MKSRKNRWLALALRGVVVALALVGVTALVSSKALSDDPPKGQGEGGFDAEMMAKYEEMNKPGPHHKNLEQFVGDWNCASKWWAAPGAEAHESKGTARYTKLYDGRYLQQDYQGSMEMPGADGKMQKIEFQGRGLLGHDNMKNEYFSIWLDSMSTGYFAESGKSDESGKEFTFTGTHDDCMTGKPVNMKSVLRVISRDKFVFEMHKETAPGNWHKEMEITYARR